MKGRKSEKKASLLKVYRFLRAMMTADDVQQLKEDYPGFKELTEENTDVEIQVAIEELVEVMSKVSPPDYERQERLW